MRQVSRLCTARDVKGTLAAPPPTSHTNLLRSALTDKATHVRVAAAAVIKSLAQESGYIATSDFDTCLLALCKGFEVRL